MYLWRVDSWAGDNIDGLIDGYTHESVKQFAFSFLPYVVFQWVFFWFLVVTVNNDVDRIWKSQIIKL